MKNISTFTYNKSNSTATIRLYDKVNAVLLPPIHITDTLEQCQIRHGKIQKEYYDKYPKLLPRNVYLYNHNKNKFFVVILHHVNSRKTIILGTFSTIQECLQAKKDFIAYNL